MSDAQTLSERTQGRPSIDELTAVIWSAEMGRRLALVRMKMLLDQRELAARFELTMNGQGTISKIELGRLPVTERITVAALKRVLGTAFMFVVFGSNPERFNSRVITDRYWDTRLRIRRKNRAKPLFPKVSSC